MSDYISRWVRENCKSVNIRFNVKKQGDLALYEHLRAQPNKTEYIKALIMRDIIVKQISEKEEE